MTDPEPAILQDIPHNFPRSVPKDLPRSADPQNFL